MTALLVIDVQKGFMDSAWGIRNNPHFEKNVSLLLAHWRESQQPVIHVQHLSHDNNSPLRPGQLGADLMDFAKPENDEPLFQKYVHSAFIGTNLEAELKRKNIFSLVLVGFTSDHCVSTTARMGVDLGFEIFIPSDAVATFDRIGRDGKRFSADEVHAVSLASLNREFARIEETSQILKTKIKELFL